MSTQHEPEVWRTVSFADGTEGVVAHVDGQNLEIATCRGRHAKRNARMIAAALDLLAACKLLVAAYGSDKPADDEDAGDSVEWEDLDRAHEAARQAIAKAEGRA